MRMGKAEAELTLESVRGINLPVTTINRSCVGLRNMTMVNNVQVPNALKKPVSRIELYD